MKIKQMCRENQIDAAVGTVFRLFYFLLFLSFFGIVGRGSQAGGGGCEQLRVRMEEMWSEFEENITNGAFFSETFQDANEIFV